MELSFDVGDIITDIKHQNDGYAFGRLEKNNRSGIYPTFKTIGVIKTFPFPTYFNDEIFNIEHSNANDINFVESKEPLGKKESL